MGHRAVHDFGQDAGVVVGDHARGAGADAGVVVDVEALDAQQADLLAGRLAHLAVGDLLDALGHSELGVGEVGHQAGRVALPGVLPVAGEEGTLAAAEHDLGRHVEEVAGLAGSALGVVAGEAAVGAAEAAVREDVEVHGDGAGDLLEALVVDGEVLDPLAGAVLVVVGEVAGRAGLHALVGVGDAVEAAVALEEGRAFEVGGKQHGAGVVGRLEAGGREVLRVDRPGRRGAVV